MWCVCLGSLCNSKKFGNRRRERRSTRRHTGRTRPKKWCARRKPYLRSHESGPDIKIGLILSLFEMINCKNVHVKPRYCWCVFNHSLPNHAKSQYLLTRAHGFWNTILVGSVRLFWAILLARHAADASTDTRRGSYQGYQSTFTGGYPTRMYVQISSWFTTYNIQLM